jgi:hypothetical protein
MTLPAAITLNAALDPLAEILAGGDLIPYLGPGMLTLCPNYLVPATPEALVLRLTAKASVPPKIRNNLTRSAQFIENFKHRKTLVNLMNEAFAAAPAFSPLHATLAALDLPLIVDTWYDDAMQTALRDRHAGALRWGQVQGLSQSEHFGHWTGGFDASGRPVDVLPIIDGGDSAWVTLLYKPLGAHAPAANYLVSDTDFVEVLTEIDIQTPIPDSVKAMRSARGFLFLGCRFNDQLSRTFARQIMKRSAGPHWAVLPEVPSRMEARFLEEQNVTRIETSLASFAEAFIAIADKRTEVA